LRRSGDTTQLGCAGTYSPPYVSFSGAPGTVEQAAKDFECIVRKLDSRGCGFEQPLEAALKALTSRDSPLSFRGDVGHADEANKGFLRNDALLAVVVLTDEDDCSMRDVDLSDPASTRLEGGLNVRCALNPDALSPLSRYLHGLRALKPGRPSHVVFSAIAGIPVERRVQGQRAASELLDLASMQVVIDDQGSGGSLRPACLVEGSSGADPARRLVSLAGLFDEQGFAGSVCDSSLRTSLRAVSTVIAEAALEAKCEASQCPCIAPFVCVDGRCTCAANQRCEPAQCGSIDDGCGGMAVCGRCAGVLQCAYEGEANTCGTDSTCPPNHVCAKLRTAFSFEPAAARILVYSDADITDRRASARAVPLREKTVAGPFAREADTYSLDVDVSEFGTVDRANLVVAALSSSAAAFSPGDQWTEAVPMRVAPGGMYELNLGTTRLIAVTPDNTTTPGHEGEGVLICGGMACATVCCEEPSGSNCGFGCPDMSSVQECDGPEDCQGNCCVTGRARTCSPSSCETTACHTTADCPAGVCSAGVCQT
jgi:hypothetical protein